MWLFHDAKYAFIAMRRKAYVVSAAALAVGIGAMVFNVFSLGSWQQYGVDFDGGVLVQVSFSQPMDDNDLRTALGGASAPPITRFGADNEYVIRAPLEEDRDIAEVAGDLEAQLAASLGESAFEVVRQEGVGPKIGQELQQRAGLAILFSLVLTLLYIAIRFEFRFGLAAVIATAHDMLIVLGLLALFRVEIALPTVAAILTILGYSLNDTIVVFDRVRENFRRVRRGSTEEVMNRSLNQTLSRTLMTSLTTLLVLVALFVFGGELIRGFATALIVGVLIGTYSSIYVASVSALALGVSRTDLLPVKKEGADDPAAP